MQISVLDVGDVNLHRIVKTKYRVRSEIHLNFFVLIGQITKPGLYQFMSYMCVGHNTGNMVETSEGNGTKHLVAKK
jgi:hypothetical protein